MAKHVAERNHMYASTALQQSREDADRRGDWRPAVRKRLQELRSVLPSPSMSSWSMD